MSNFLTIKQYMPKEMDDGEIKEVLYEYYFTKVHGNVFLHKRWNKSEWETELTAYKEIPIISY